MEGTPSHLTTKSTRILLPPRTGGRAERLSAALATRHLSRLNGMYPSRPVPPGICSTQTSLLTLSFQKLPAYSLLMASVLE